LLLKQTRQKTMNNEKEIKKEWKRQKTKNNEKEIEKEWKRREQQRRKERGLT
jgi:hypothetical protein